MRTLDRSFFRNEIPIAAARVANNRNILSWRKELEKSKDLLFLERISPCHPDPELASQGKKCLLLRPGIRQDGTFKPSIFHCDVQQLTATGRHLNMERQTDRARPAAGAQRHTVPTQAGL